MHADARRYKPEWIGLTGFNKTYSLESRNRTLFEMPALNLLILRNLANPVNFSRFYRRVSAFDPPLQGAHRLASRCRSSGVGHGPRIPGLASRPSFGRRGVK